LEDNYHGEYSSRKKMDLTQKPQVVSPGDKSSTEGPGFCRGERRVGVPLLGKPGTGGGKYSWERWKTRGL